MKPQSKSKTFPKGTDTYNITNWVLNELETTEVKTGIGSFDFYVGSKLKYIITITKFPDKEEGK